MATMKKAAGAAAAAGPVLDWLLEEDDPAVRLFALTRLCGEAEDSPKAAKARAALMKTGPAAEILKLQDSGGWWGESAAFYTDKYGGTVWQLLVLAELGADGSDPRVGSAIEFLLANSQDRESGGFSTEASSKGGGRPGTVIPCLTGNMAWAMTRLGCGDDPRVAAAIDWIRAHQQARDGEEVPPSTCAHDQAIEACFGRHSCFMGVVKSLKALAAIPPRKRSAAVKAAIAELAEFILVHRVHKKSHDLSKVSRPGWLKFGFPLMYQTDILEILCLLAELGISDERASDAADAVEAARGADGRWKMANSFNGKTLVDIDRKGEASKWITARALYALAGQGRRP
jgi:hypothetical protein